MKIEVACKQSATNKEKGDLLELLSKKLLESQSYSVIEEIRFTGVELDLLCEHKVSKKQIYVECKAQKKNISAPILRQLLGTVSFKNYSEGWLISTAEFGKEAKGFSEEWKSRPPGESSKLSFYTPALVISSLVDARVIVQPPRDRASEVVGGNHLLGDWTLLVTEFGFYWCVYTLSGGVPSAVLVFESYTGQPVLDEKILDNLSKLESTFRNYNLKIGIPNPNSSSNSATAELPLVVEVQTGDSWEDYRPARPQDFVGRDLTQKNILNFLESAKLDETGRVFAITGNSGLGKSSLIAKLRDRTRNKRYKNKYFVYAVDIRGAKSSSYILSSFLNCLQKAQAAGFGDELELTLTDPISPLNSPSIKEYLASVGTKGQIICLVLDQFEELYSKPELFEIFNAAKDLMLDVAGSKKSFVLGFAWKTDSTTQQDHPAYHMWHELSDHRKVFKLDVFDSGEVSKSITTFEKEIGKKISAATRLQITQNSQGFPWLLKKLCIHLFDRMHEGGSSSESTLVDIDAGKLFDADIQALTVSQLACLKLVANKAPADWSEIIDVAGVTDLNSLIHKRLVVKSGDRLNIYWDIFKDYLLTGHAPIIPFNYVPSTDVSSLAKLCAILSGNTFQTAEELSTKTKFKEKTIWNIGADLVMFGLAEREGTSFKLQSNLSPNSTELMLNLLRDKLGKHTLKLKLFENYLGKTVERSIIEHTLVDALPRAKNSARTWFAYSNRLASYMVYTGFLVRVKQSFIVQDTGSPVKRVADAKGYFMRRRKGSAVFAISVSPYDVCHTLEATAKSILKESDLKRNAIAALRRFDLIVIQDGIVVPNSDLIRKYGGEIEAVWTVAKNEAAINKAIQFLDQNNNKEHNKLGEFISNEFELDWSAGSKEVNGRIMTQWSLWIRDGIENSQIPTPPGRSANPNPSLVKGDGGIIT